jgi:hypothetical protein
MNHVKKVEALYKLIKETVGEIGITEAYVLVNHIYRFYKKDKKTPLTEKEKAVYDVFVREKICPTTAYDWFGFFRLDKDLQREIKNGKLLLRTAERIQCGRRKETREGLEQEILADIMKCITMLKQSSNLGEVV